MAFAGNTLAEYALISGVFLGVSVMALSGLGNSISGQWDSFTQSMARSASRARLAITNPALQSQRGADTTALAGGSNSTKGQWSNLATDSRQAIMAVQTIGANGVTDELATMLTAQVAQLKESGTLTEAEANALLLLADRGHQLAAAQKMVEDSIMQGKSSVTFEGRTYSIKDFADSVGFSSHGGVEMLTNLPPDQANSNFKPFAEQYQVVKQSGMLEKPEVQAEISALVYQIAFVTDTLRWTALDIVDAGTVSSQTEESFKTELASHYLENLGEPSLTLEAINASVITNQNSGKICKAGSGSSCIP
jgi:Flp pilus assembly pilin Flp